MDRLTHDVALRALNDIRGAGTPPTAAVAAGEPDPVGLTVIAACGAALSMVATGFLFGIDNNLFHLPIVGQLYNEPQFQADAYMQSLRFYSAGPFLLLQGADRYVDPEKLFFVLQYATRLLTFVGFLTCGRLLGLVGRGERALFAVLLAFTELLNGASLAGGGGMLTSYFTHSDIANGLSLLALYHAARRRIAVAFAFNGATFFVNAFVAVWNALPLGFIIALLLLRRRLTPVQAIGRGATGLALFLALASPVLVNVLANPDFGRPFPIDYRLFLAEYFPYHFLPAWNSPYETLGLAAIAGAGAMSFLILRRRPDGRDADLMLAALLGFLVTYAAGMLAPQLTSNPAILNLHLLRSSSSIQLLVALGALTLATVWQTGREPDRARVFAPALIITLCSIQAAMFAAPIVIIGGVITRLRGFIPRSLLVGWPVTPALLVIVLLLGWSSRLWKQQRMDGVIASRVAQWTELGRWARQNTAPDAVFLVPTHDLMAEAASHSPPSDPFTPWVGEEMFDYASHRQVWVDLRRGAAAMWSPSYYPVWERRFRSVLNLSSLNEKLTYAADHGVAYVINQCAAAGPPPSFNTRDFCIYPVPFERKTPSGQTGLPGGQ